MFGLSYLEYITVLKGVGNWCFQIVWGQSRYL